MVIDTSAFFSSPWGRSLLISTSAQGLGSYRAFVTDHSRPVVLRFPGRADGEVLVVSPDDPEAFVTRVTGHR